VKNIIIMYYLINDEEVVYGDDRENNDK